MRRMIVNSLPLYLHRIDIQTGPMSIYGNFVSTNDVPVVGVNEGSDAIFLDIGSDDILSMHLYGENGDGETGVIFDIESIIVFKNNTISVDGLFFNYDTEKYSRIELDQQYIVTSEDEVIRLL